MELEPSYIRYNNLKFASLDIDKLVEDVGDSSNFLFSTVFQKRFNLDVNLKRHEDHKLFYQTREINYFVLDCLQITRDEATEQYMEYPLLYVLAILPSSVHTPESVEDMCGVLLKRYDSPSIALKWRGNSGIIVMNRDGSKKQLMKYRTRNEENTLKNFLKSIENKEFFKILGREIVTDTMKQAYSRRIRPGMKQFVA